jgi:hypothetical protein
MKHTCHWAFCRTPNFKDEAHASLIGLSAGHQASKMKHMPVSLGFLQDTKLLLSKQLPHTNTTTDIHAVEAFLPQNPAREVTAQSTATMYLQQKKVSSLT